MKRRLAIIAAILSLAPTAALAGQAPEDAVARGRQVLARAVDHAGGAERVRELRYFSLRLEAVEPGQAGQYVPASSTSARPEVAEISITADLLGKRIYREDVARVSGTWQRVVSLVREGQRFALVLSRQEYSVEPGNAAAPIAQAATYLPPLLLKRAAANADSVRWVGETSVLDQPADVIEFSWDPQTRIRLAIGREAARVLQFEQPAAAGEEPLRIVYRSERDAEGYRVPQQILQVRRGEVVLELVLAEVTFSEPAVDITFDVPSSYRQVERRPIRAGAN